MTTELLVLAGRILFGGYFAFNGFNHFKNSGQMTGYAESKGVPYASAAVYLTGLMLLAGGLGVAAGAYPAISLGLIGAFLLVVTPKMHDFYNMEGEQRQEQMTHFMKNTALLGAALALTGISWSTYAVGTGLGLL
ncbi:MAG: DoxX family membrane protein [Candidatus Nanohaloarchaea archaeon]